MNLTHPSTRMTSSSSSKFLCSSIRTHCRRGIVVLAAVLLGMVVWWGGGGNDWTNGTESSHLLLSLDSSSKPSSDRSIPMEVVPRLPSKTKQRRVGTNQNQKPPLPVAAKPWVWTPMVQTWNLHSILELGTCSSVTAWFHSHGLTPAHCVVPNRYDDDANVLPHSWIKTRGELMVEHDYSQGPWWPETTVDLAWMEGDLVAPTLVPDHLDHVVGSLNKAALLVIRSAASKESPQSSVQALVHALIHQYQFKPHLRLTQTLQAWDAAAPTTGTTTAGAAASSTWHVFLNPVVAALPDHMHLFYEPGCYHTRGPGNRIIQRPCQASKLESVLPDHFMLPLQLPNATFEQAWQSYEAAQAAHAPQQPQ